MSKTVWRITPVNGYDLPALAGWLEKMAAKGLRFYMTAGPLTMFETAAPTQVRIHLEPIQGNVADDPELNALYEEAGWEYRGMFRHSCYVFSTTDREAVAHTDPEVWNYALTLFWYQKLVAGLGLLGINLILLLLYWPSSSFSLADLRAVPVYTIYRYHLIPFTLSVLGLLCVDFSYFTGLRTLFRLRKGRKTARPSRGWVLALGVLLLLPVGIETGMDFFGLTYSPYPLEGSGFVTLTDIEGDDILLSGDHSYNMDRISHGSSLLDSESWYFQQYASFPQYHGASVNLNAVNRLEITVSRYPFSVLAKQRAAELTSWSTWSSELDKVNPSYDLDQVLVSPSKAGTHLVLRQGRTVLQAYYCGSKDLTDHLDRFAQMLEGL